MNSFAASYTFLAQGPAGFLQEVWASLRTALFEMVTGGTNLLPRLIGAVIIFVIGYFVAKLIQKTILFVGTKAGLDKLIGEGGLQRMLKSAGFKEGFTTVLAKAVFYGFVLYFGKFAADHTQVPMLMDPINGIVTLLPKFITAILIAGVGYIVADLVRNLTARTCERAGLDYAHTLSNLVFAFIIVLVLIIAIGELGVDTKLIHDTVVIVLAGIALAIGLALGLGLRPLAHAIVSGVYVRDLFKPGTEIVMDGDTLAIVSVGPLNTKLGGENGEFVVVSNSRLIAETVKGREE